MGFISLIQINYKILGLLGYCYPFIQFCRKCVTTNKVCYTYNMLINSTHKKC